MDQIKNEKQNFRHQKAEQERKYLKYPGELIHLGKNNPNHLFNEEQKLGSSIGTLVRKIDFGFPLFCSLHLNNHYNLIYKW